MWIVYYWANCSHVGEYLEKMRFDNKRDAVKFAKSVDGRVENRLAFA